MIINCKNMVTSEIIKNKFQKFSNFKKKKKSAPLKKGIQHFNCQLRGIVYC